MQNLTGDRTRLLAAIAAASPSIGISNVAASVPQMGKLDPVIDGQCLCGVCVPEAIMRVADAVRDLPRRRKVMFFIGSDVMWQPPPKELRNRPFLAPVPPSCEVPLKDARTAMFAAVDRANLTVHSIDPSGLLNIGDQTQAGIRGAGLDGVAGGGYGPNARAAAQGSNTNDALARRESLALLPERTGGRTIVGANNPEQSVPAIFHESDAYYVLAIERAASAREDATRSIEVKVTKRGLRVVSQRSYGAPPEPADPLTGLLPGAGVPLSMAVTPFANPEGARPVVRVNVDARGFVHADGSPAALEIEVLAVDRTGKEVASARQTSTIAAPSSPTGTAPEVNVQSHLELEPGDYGIRVALTDAAASKTASVFADTTVPKFDEASLSLSGVSVETIGAGARTPSPTTRRAFARGEQVRAVMQIYQGTQRAEPLVPVSMRVQILDAKGASVIDQSLPFAETAFTNRRADCVITLPIAKLPSGDYLLKLEASTKGHASGRALRFVVE